MKKKNENGTPKVLDRLIEILYEENDETPPAVAAARKPDLFRALCNLRAPKPVSEEFLRLQDEYLTSLTRERGVVSAEEILGDEETALWQGDITRLDADGIVNACNQALLGCFQPLHNCIDNVIHSAAGVQVRLDCYALLKGRVEPRGTVRVTKAYNLPSKYIFHTVGPVIFKEATKQDEKDLENCYLSCLEKAREMGLHTLAFCCLSTGVYAFPKKEACRIAVRTVRTWKKEDESGLKVIFDVFEEEDRQLYERELAGADD